MSIEVAYFKTFVMIQEYTEKCSPIGGFFEVVIFQKASRNNQQYKYMYIRIYIYKTIDRGVCSYEVIGRSRVQVYYVAFQRADLDLI